MHYLDPSAGSDWLLALQQHGDVANYVSDLRPSLREADDGSTEIFATIVLKDSIMMLLPAQRRELLSRLERWLKGIILGGPYAGLGWPLVGFVTETEARHTTRRS